MPKNLTATASISIAAPAARVWQALTDPVEVKQIMFGSDVVSDWKKGSSLIYRGTWEGKPFEDKGTILEIAPPYLLRTSYFSPLSGRADIPENYAEISYVLREDPGGTTLTVTQGNIRDEAGKAQAEGNWGMVLGSIRTLIEG